MERDPLRKPLFLVALIGLILAFLTGYHYLLVPNDGADAGECRGVSMYPSFARIRSFDESHTRFASKFSLYLYREQGKDPIPKHESEGFSKLDGIPALFIPGNAGSYRQMRSIAAEISNLHFDDNIDVVKNPHAKNVDFFGADFNEDFTAFHGRTLLDQAEYLNEAIRFILLLYLSNPDPPVSVLILAHSMGGIVARVLPTLPNYVPDSVNTIITLSLPHSAAPLTFDGDILKIYLAIDRFWYDAFNPGPTSLGLAQQRLGNVSIVSITGGMLDNVLPADYTTLGFLVPPSNGFTVYTTGIPDVWTSMDHLAIVWCRQLRRQLLLMILELVDVTSPNRTYPLEKRMEVMRRHLLSGFETYAKQDQFPPSDLFTLRFDAHDMRAPSQTHTLSHSLWLWNELNQPITSFALGPLTTVLIIAEAGLKFPDVDSTGISVLLCRKPTEKEERVVNLAKSAGLLDLTCVDLSDKLNDVPRSAEDVNAIMDSSFDGDKSPFKALRLLPNDFSGFDRVVIVDRRDQNNKESSFVYVETQNVEETQLMLQGDLNLFSRGVSLKLSPMRSMGVNVHIPGAWSSILAYHAKIRLQSDVKDTAFKPFIRQWVADPYETKWHINIKDQSDLLLSMHGIAPFTPYNTKSRSTGLNLEFWVDPQLETEDSQFSLSIKVDWIKSLKLLVLRYRLAVVSQCLAVTMLAAMFQFNAYFNSGNFPDFLYGLLKVTLRAYLVPILVILYMLTPLTKLKTVQQFLNIIDPVVLRDPNELNLSVHDDYLLNSFFLGLQESSLAFLSWVLFAMAVGLNVLLYYIIQLVGYIFVTLSDVAVSIISKQSNVVKKELEGFSAMKRKLITAALIMGAVLIYLPYQFAYMVCFAIQAITTVRSMRREKNGTVRNYNTTLLVLMLWVLPINVPVLIVFVHNLNINWTTPFSSHHNIMAVAPIVALTEMNSLFPGFMPLKSAKSEKRPTKTVGRRVIMTISGYTVFYCVIYGARHTFWLHHLFNVWCSWLLIGYLEQIFNTKDGKSS